MKSYTDEEKTQAEKKLPPPVLDFLLSPALSTIYIGIQNKHKLDLRQLGLLSEVVNVTLMGLEPESALETNLHQTIHELSNEGTRELAADINDRVFKEARRRLAEDVREPSVWSEEILHPLSEKDLAAIKEEQRINNMADDDPELLALQKKEDAIEAERRRKQDEELAEALRQAAEEEAKQAAGAETQKNPEGEAPPPEQGASIAAEKLALPKISKTEEVKAPPLKEVPAESGPLKKVYRNGNDPYREPIE